MASIQVYNQSGKPEGAMELPERVFGLPWNADLIWQVATSEMGNRRQNVAHVKGRGEVRGGGKKPWRQKGTGRARHGSIRSPIWKGGGVTHGPTRAKRYDRVVPKKMAARALAVILSAKLKKGELIVLDSLNLATPKTREAAKIFNALAKVKDFTDIVGKRPRALVLLDQNALTVRRAFRNLPNLALGEARNVTALDLLNRKYIVLPRAGVEAIIKRLEHV